MITGSNGLLGQKLVKLFLGKPDYEIHALSRGLNRLDDQKGYKYYDIDLLDNDKLITLLTQILPDVIIHTAAMTNVDACELQQEECDRMNIEVVAMSFSALCHFPYFVIIRTFVFPLLSLYIHKYKYMNISTLSFSVLRHFPHFTIFRAL